MTDLFDVDAAFTPVERNAVIANRRRPDGTRPKTGLRSHWHRQPHDPGVPGSLERHETPDPRRSDAVKPGIQCVRRGALTPWNTGSSASGGSGPEAGGPACGLTAWRPAGERVTGG